MIRHKSTTLCGLCASLYINVCIDPINISLVDQKIPVYCNDYLLKKELEFIFYFYD